MTVMLFISVVITGLSSSDALHADNKDAAVTQHAKTEIIPAINLVLLLLINTVPLRI